MQLGGGSFQSLRQPGRMSAHDSMGGQRLIFIYPFICDEALNRQTQIARLFFTASLISEIKYDNGLRITSDAQRNIGALGQNTSNPINPADVIRQSLYSQNSISHNNVPIDSWTNQEYRMLYQDKIDQFNIFVQDQLKNNPLFHGLNPIISSITISNLLSIPLIVGTKSYSVSSEYMYLILLVSIMTGTPLTGTSNLDYIFNIIDHVPAHMLRQLILDENSIKKINRIIGHDITTDSIDSKQRLVRKQSSSTFNIYGQNVNKSNIDHKLYSYLSTEHKKAQIFFGICMNEQRWAAENNGIETRGRTLSVSEVSIPTTIQNKHYTAAISTFNIYIENIIVPAYRLLTILGGPAPIGCDVSKKVAAVIDDISTNRMDDFLNLAQQITSAVISKVKNHGGSLSREVKDLVSICKENVNIANSIEKSLSDYNKNMTGNLTYNSNDIEKAINAIIDLSQRIKPHEKTIDSWLTNIISGSGDPLDPTRPTANLTTKLSSIAGQFNNTILSSMWGRYPERSPDNAPWFTNISDPQTFVERYRNYAGRMHNIYIGVDNTTFNNRTYAQHNNNTLNPADISEFYSDLNSIEQSLFTICNFLLKWTFFSFTCSYMSEVDADVEVQKQDALEFPNFCLVIPLNLMKGLYSYISTRNIRNIHSKTFRKPTDFWDVLDKEVVIPNFNDVKRLITIVANQLQVPNLILMDDADQTCWYKFMYMDSAIKIKYSAMKQFIEHQQDILPRS